VARTLFEPEPVVRRRRLPQRWVLVTLAVVGLLAWFVLSIVLDGTRAVVDRDAERAALQREAKAALPVGALDVSSGFNGALNVYAIADVATPPAEVLTAFGPGWGGDAWNAIPGAATARSRSYLSAGQNRIFEVKASPCAVGRPSCPAGGSTVVIEIAPGGPKS
jgi:hypothetical protein